MTGVGTIILLGADVSLRADLHSVSFGARVDRDVDHVPNRKAREVRIRQPDVRKQAVAFSRRAYGANDLFSWVSHETRPDQIDQEHTER